MSNHLNFRKEALDALHSPEQLDQLVQLVTPSAWVAMIMLYGLLTLLLEWAVLGSIPTYVIGKGILLARGGDIYSAAAPEGSSYIKQITVKEGEKIAKGTIVAYLARPDLNEAIKAENSYLASLQKKYDQLLMVAKQDLSLKQQHLNQQRTLLDNTLKVANDKMLHYEALAALKKKALKEGLDTRQNFEQALQDFYTSKNDIETYQNQRVEINISASNFLDQWRERLRDLDLKIAEEKLKLLTLQTKLNLASQVISPVAGIVTHIHVALGGVVETGAPLLSIASEGEGQELDALIFITPRYGKQVKPGMLALISPTTIEKEEFGSIRGKVISVSDFPTPQISMRALLQNEELVKNFSQEEAPIAVRVHLFSDSKTFSGFKWSSSKGPQQKVTPGTLANAMVTVREQSPLSLVFPAIKKVLGIS